MSIKDIEVRPAGAKGVGVFALRTFRKGEFIFRRRNGRAIVLPPGAYLNHSCEPSAMRRGVKVFAWRPIRRGEEITIDYRLNAFGGARSRCLCGSPSCSGWIVGDFFALSPSRQRAYLPYAPAFIKREYRRRSSRPYPSRPTSSG